MWLSYLIQLGKKIGLSAIFLVIPANVVKAEARLALAPVLKDSALHNGDASFLAQITPDSSLESTVQQLQELIWIDGGQRAGNNLFHSFSEFNISEGMEASFQNAINIENIFTRVTGNSISNIDGILSTQGGANFFLMNPNGIFGVGE